MKLLLVAAASLAVVSCVSLSLDDLEFHAWKLKFGKVYRSPEEEAWRRDIWLSTRRTVLVHNILADQGIKTYRMGMNHLSDMDEKEYHTALNGSRWHLDFMKNTLECKIPDFQGTAALPASVDWRDKSCVTPVKDQGDCGSCWAFSAVGALESHNCIKHKRLTALSEQQLVDCAKSDGCSAGTALDAFGYCMKSQGIVKEKDYRYKDKESSCPFKKNKISSKKIGAKCTGCRRVQTNEKSLQQEVAERGPVSVTIVLHKSFDKYKSGVYYEPGCAKIPKDERNYHSMLVVGYGTTRKGEKYWQVKNSYGNSWGEEGYIRMARNKKNNCDIATYAFYPVVK